MTEHDALMWTLPLFGSLISFIGAGVLSQLKKLTSTIQTLSVDMAVIAERVNHHEKRINHLERVDHH